MAKEKKHSAYVEKAGGLFSPLVVEALGRWTQAQLWKKLLPGPPAASQSAKPAETQFNNRL